MSLVMDRPKLTFDQRKVLVLNKSWSAISIHTIKEALPLLFKEDDAGKSTAQIVVPSESFSTYTWADWSKLRPAEGEDFISTTHQTFRVPEVILLTKQSKMYHKAVHFSRRALYRRDNYSCQYCGCKPGSEELTIDHILPRYQGGLTTWHNCTVACVKCNSFKAARTPEQAGMVLRSKPTVPKFDLVPDRKSVPKSWTHFLSEAFWNVELENDN